MLKWIYDIRISSVIQILGAIAEGRDLKKNYDHYVKAIRVCWFTFNWCSWFPKSFTQALAAGGEVGAAIGDVIVMNQKCLFLSQYKANWVVKYFILVLIKGKKNEVCS